MQKPGLLLYCTGTARRKRGGPQRMRIVPTPGELQALLPILEHLDDGIVATDDDFRVTYLNRAAERTFGVHSDRAAGKTINEVIVMESFQMVFGEIFKSIDSQRAWRGNMLCAGPEGRQIRLDCSVMRLPPRSDGSAGLLIRTRDAPDDGRRGDADGEPERFYRDLVELSDDGICIVQDRKLKFANLQLANILGWPLTDLLDTYIERHVDPAEMPALADVFDLHLKGAGKLGVIETVLVSRSGSRTPVEITGSVITFEGANASLLDVRDVTVRKRAEEALRASEEQYRTLVENLNVGVYRNTVDQPGRFLHANPAFARIFGFDSVADFKSITVGDLYQNPEDRRQFLDELLRTGHIRNKELRLQRRDGTPIWASISAQVKYGRDSDVLWVDGVIEDVTSRRRTKEALRQSEETARALLNAPSEMAVLVDSDGVIIGLNDYAARSLRGSPDELIGVHGLDFLPPDMAAEVAKLFGEVTRSGQPGRYQLDFGGRWFDFGVYPAAREEGKVIRMAVSVHDITDQKEAEGNLRQALRHAQEADLLKSRFLANMSHEIRTPLNAVIGLTTLLMLDEDMAEAERNGYYQNIKHSAESLLGMINAILGMAKIESGTLRSNPVPFDLGAFIQNLRRRHQPQMDAKLLDFRIEVDPDVPGTVVGDPVLLEQALNNLLANAFKFTDQGWTRLGVTVQQRKEQRLTLLFQVQDTGIGIPEEQQDLLFQPFFQVDGSATREHQGTGLGLSIARESVLLMGGEIWLESAPQAGTTFQFTCPVRLVAPAAKDDG